MEKNLEHKIAEAFQNKDASTKYPGKEELWNRISNAQNSNAGVLGFWRAAAVILAMFFIGGAFSSILFINKKTNQLVQSERLNSELQNTVDSLLSITTETITEIKYIEKEVQVFVPFEKKLDKSEFEKEKILALQNENIQLRKQSKTEAGVWQNKTDSLVRELLVLNKMLEEKNNAADEIEKAQKNVVELKPEKYEMPLQQPTQSANPKLKIQIFPNPVEKTNFDMNTSIFKK